MMLMIGSAAMAQYGLPAGPDIDLVGSYAAMELLLAGIPTEHFNVIRSDNPIYHRTLIILQDKNKAHERVCALDFETSLSPSFLELIALPFERRAKVLGQEVNVITPTSQWCLYEGLKGTDRWRPKFYHLQLQLEPLVEPLTPAHQQYIETLKAESEIGPTKRNA